MTIGIVDTGIDTGNSEFSGRISSASADVAGSRGINPENDHGTLVALVAAGGRNNSGVMGIAYDATILMARADNPGSCASSDGCSFFGNAISAGIDRAVQNGAKVINLSLGGSAPTTQLRNAVGRAAAAGVVVVVAAGNDADSAAPSTDLNNPDPFAVGLRQAGNGNVIIAGSVDDSGSISAFSNRAGVEASSYLMALGGHVCCVYSGSTIKITTQNGQQFVTVVSGTSFSAPQIAGAVALLRQAFPNLTAVQTVDLLLSSARDAGTAGTDAVYGRGILDIASAFAPKGTTSFASTLEPLPSGDTTVAMSPAMGDAAGQAPLSAVMLDSYQRAYRMELGDRVLGTAAQPRLGPALLAPMEAVTGGDGTLALGFSVDRQGLRAGQRWTGLLRLGRADAEGAKVLAARVAARIAPNTQVAFGFAQGADGLIGQVQGHSEPAFLIARSPVDDFGFARRGETSMALRQQFGRTGMTLSAERSAAVPGAVPQITGDLSLRRPGAAVSRLGVSFDRRFGAFETSVAVSWLSESRTVLGARLHDAFGARGADSWFLDMGVAWPFAEGWRLGGAWRQGFTRARSGGLVAPGSHLASDAWSVDLARSNVFAGDDSLAFRLSQPLRVRSGGLNLDLPIAYNYATLTATSGISRLDLSPHGREITGELVWHGPLWAGSASASLFYRRNPGNYSSLPADKGIAVSWKTGL